MSISANFDSKALIATLQKLPKNIQNNVMSGAIRAGANIVRDEAKRRVPKRTGNLAKSITTIKRKAEKGQFIFSVTPAKGGRNNGWYAHFIEYGTVKMSAKPFLRPAFEQKNNESLEAVKEYIATRLPSEVDKSK